jgi:hypothetical protein
MNSSPLERAPHSEGATEENQMNPFKRNKLDFTFDVAVLAVLAFAVIVALMGV